MNQNYLVREIILKYHRGEPLTDEEQTILDAELAKLPSEKVWERIRSHVESETAVVRPWYFRARTLTAAAAAMVLLAGGWYLFIRPAGRDLSGALAVVQRVWRTVAPGHYYQELEGPGGIEVVDSASGGQSVPYAVTLPDGSRVTLSYGSSVRFTKGFGVRKVVLAGQAHFDVVKDPRPFVVESGKTTVQVLGTQFNWMNYPGLPGEITLLTGKIELSRGNFRQVMRPADRAVIREGNPARVKVQPMARPEETVAWMGTRPEVVFDSTELSVVIQRLAQYYQVGFHVDAGLAAGRPVTGIMDLKLTLEENLEPIRDIVKDYAKVTDKDGMIEVTDTYH